MIARAATDAELREHQELLARDRAAWERLLLRSDVAPGAKLTGLVIAIHTDDSGQRGAWLSHTDLHRATGLSVNQVRYYLDVLERFGWLQRPAGPGGPWYLHWPPGHGS